MNTITSKDGTQIYYKDWGKGPVVTFSHGWPLNADAWDGQMHFLAQHGFRVIAHDRRGHGRSSQASSGNDMNGYADDLAAVIETLDLRERHARGSLDRRRRSRALHRAPWHEARGQSRADCRRSAAHAEDLGESRRPADGSVRRHSRGSRRGSLAVLQGPGRPVLWRQSGRREGLTRHARSVLALEHAERPEECIRKHQGVLRNRLHRGPEEDRRPDAGPARRG